MHLIKCHAEGMLYYKFHMVLRNGSAGGTLTLQIGVHIFSEKSPSYRLCLIRAYDTFIKFVSNPPSRYDLYFVYVYYTENI